MSSDDSDGKALALQGLLIEATLLHNHVAAATRRIAGPDDLSNAQVSILRSLASSGPSTVPELAAERAIARQPVQRSVSELENEGLVELAPNPRHKRSRLVRLTRSGERRLTRMERQQRRWLERASDAFSERSLRMASSLLRRIREEIHPKRLSEDPHR